MKVTDVYTITYSFYYDSQFNNYTHYYCNIKKLDLVDRPNFRKVHTKPISVMGGTVILFSFLIGIWLGHPIEREVKPLILGAITMYMVGLIDDIYDLRPYLKLAGQIVAALIVTFYGITIDFISLPIGPTIHFGIFSIPITVIWIVAITNAINLIDGLDGLASGVSALALMTIGFIAILQANIFIIMICCVLLGLYLVSYSITSPSENFPR